MGYYSVNQATIERRSTQREIAAAVYCEELQRWEEKVFPWEQLTQALAWVEEKMNRLSM